MDRMTQHSKDVNCPQINHIFSTIPINQKSHLLVHTIMWKKQETRMAKTILKKTRVIIEGLYDPILRFTASL